MIYFQQKTSRNYIIRKTGGFYQNENSKFKISLDILKELHLRHFTNVVLFLHRLHVIVLII